MSGNRLVKFRKLLQQKELELTRTLRKFQFASCSSPEDGERRQFEVDRELAAATCSRQTELLEKVETALARMSSGGYGICDNCEDQIPRRRLEAVPWTLYCRDCQEKLEESRA